MLFFFHIFQVIASVLRNLSWRADVNSKKTLREVGSVKALMECALEVKKVSSMTDEVEFLRHAFILHKTLILFYHF